MKSAGVAEANGGEKDEGIGGSRHNPVSPVWTDTMSTRFHIMAATAGYQPSFLAIGDAFFYGRGGFPRYVLNIPLLLSSQYTLFIKIILQPLMDAV